MSRATVERLYTAFAHRDGATMASCYAPEALFVDPVFELRGAEIGRMWQMLCARGRDLEIEYEIVHAAAERAAVDWVARYRFGGVRGRPVVNRIKAELTLRDGLIVVHRDHFDFARWARQALGPIGWLAGHTRWLRTRVQAQARAQLARHRHSEAD